MTTGIPAAPDAALAGGVITDANWDEFGAIVVGAINHMIDGGEPGEIFGAVASKEAAAEMTKAWLEEHRGALVEGGVEFLTALVAQVALTEQPTQSAAEFEASLESMTDEQLTQLSELNAAQATALRKDVVDRRRALFASLIDLGGSLLRGAVATGLQAAIVRR